METLKKLFAPRSIAIVGVSRREGSLGKMFLDAVVGMPYTGKIYPVNPKADQINNLPCYPDIRSLPEVPELAVLLLPKESVLPAVQELAQKGVRALIVISAGFKEVGETGIELEKNLVEFTRANHIRMIGPNCMGLFNTHPEVMLQATFSPTQPIPGHVGFISQSGALGVAILELSKTLRLGFSVFVSTGNKADVTEVDALKYLMADDNTTVITLYQESIDHPEEFRALCTEIVPHKPILALKAGRTGSGYRAASSHTGALAADDILTDAFLRQCGIIRCKTLEEFLHAVLAFSKQPLPEGNRVAVITNSGGPAILASDALESFGLQLASLDHATTDRLQQLLPAEASCRNPVDMIASADHDTYKNVYALVEQDSNVDAIIVIIVKPPVSTTPEKIIEELSPTLRSSGKPFLLVLMATIEDLSGYTFYQKYSIPVFTYPEAAAEALGKMWEYRQIRHTHKPIKFSAQKKKLPAKGKSPVQATFTEIAKRLAKYKLPLVPHLLCREPAECIEFFRDHGPVALKIANPEIIHKSDAGLVQLNLADSNAVERAYHRLVNRALPLLPAGSKPGIMAQKMIPPGVELVLGYKYDPIYGDVLMFGMGGVLVELYKDVAFRILPITQEEIMSMISGIRGSKLLNGYRHLPAFNLDNLVNIISQFSALVTASPDILEMDLNPLIWPAGAPQPVIADCRMTLGR